MTTVINLNAKNTIEINEQDLTVKLIVKGKTKINYKFKNLASTEKYAQNLAQEIFSEERKEVAKKQAFLQNVSEIKVGDVFVSSGGYEQTNVYFYQVVAKFGKQSITVRRIAMDKNYTHSMSGDCTPVTDNFIGENENKRLSNINGAAYFDGGWGMAQKWCGKPLCFSEYA